ncbi:hypothetical protein ACSDR0_49530 [Streptosporangium sp. G11]|uniref:hypothetical protein n=1 Tax=Streptosporangium sp. G11 TaxID=3436926 RepID=UPI003EBA9023
MPVTGWETGAGDLRVAHFVGLHALQVLPLVAIGLGMLSRRFSVLAGAATRGALVIVAAFGYAGLTGLLLWQAQRGHALIHPDGLTLLAAVGLAALVVAGAGLILAVSTRRVRAVPAQAE